MRHRLTNQETICFGSPRRSVHSSAWVLNTPCGSRIRTQRRGTAGSPVLYQMAVLELTSIVRSSPPYHSATVMGLQVVRSEEHTSELQSRQYLVCRLLLEKKKKKIDDKHMLLHTYKIT